MEIPTLPRKRAGSLISASDYNQLCDWIERVARIRAQSPLSVNYDQTGPVIKLSGDRPFWAQILTAAGGANGLAYGWQQIDFRPFGRVTPTYGGRKGSTVLLPAFEVNQNAEVPLKALARLYPAGDGLSFWFDFPATAPGDAWGWAVGVSPTATNIYDGWLLTPNANTVSFETPPAGATPIWIGSYQGESLQLTWPYRLVPNGTFSAIPFGSSGPAVSRPLYIVSVPAPVAFASVLSVQSFGLYNATALPLFPGYASLQPFFPSLTGQFPCWLWNPLELGGPGVSPVSGVNPLVVGHPYPCVANGNITIPTVGGITKPLYVCLAGGWVSVATCDTGTLETITD